jgi:hypothetical protein
MVITPSMPAASFCHDTHGDYTISCDMRQGIMLEMSFSKHESRIKQNKTSLIPQADDIRPCTAA